MEGTISIHAPTRGATCALSNSFVKKVFQSTHPHGVRLHAVKALAASQTFQSTHPHGVRRQCFYGFVPDSDFNPRTHTGCDCKIQIYIYSELRHIISSFSG